MLKRIFYIAFAVVEAAICVIALILTLDANRGIFR